MSKRHGGWTKLLVACVALAHFACLAVAAEEPGPRIRFESSCATEAQDDLLRGITLLHSFEYPETERIFGELIERLPDCALAYWGAAMSLWHPLWAPPSEQALARGAALLARAEGLETTPREAAYLDALEAFFSSTDTTTHRQRAQAYELAMAEVYADHLDDAEAAVFYALALLATADPHDKSYAHQFKSAGLLNWVLTSHPDHPGALHYLIHSYDYPGLAHLALDAAKIYAKAFASRPGRETHVAPGSPIHPDSAGAADDAAPRRTACIWSFSCMLRTDIWCLLKRGPHEEPV